jgi:Domain of unknown function (DUF4279)
VWEVRVGPAESVAFDEQIEDLLEVFGQKATEVGSLRERLGADVQLGCTAYVDDLIPSIHFDREAIRLLALMGAEIDVDIMLTESLDILPNRGLI